MDLGIGGRVAIVTGAAGGVGQALVRALAEQGARVVLCDVNVIELEKLDQRLRPGDHLVSAADVSQVSECQRLVQETLERYHRIDILVNGAAIIHRVPIEDVTENDWNKMFEVNLKSQFFLSRAVVAHMAQQRWGRIINFSSQGAISGGFVSSAVYAITKGGVLTLTKSFARAYASDGICVNAVAPGGVNTEMMQISPAQRDTFISQVPLGRLAEPDELVGPVLFLASQWSSYVTGAILDVNGGQLMR